MPNDLSSPTGVLDSPTTAVLHGMMSTLSEVLGGIDGRLASLEAQLRDARAETGSPRALAQTVEAAVARLAERIEALEAAVVSRPTRDDGLHAAVDALRQSIDALAVRPVRDDELHAAIAALAARPEPAPVFDAELRSAVADLRHAIADLAARPQPEPVFDHELRAAVAELAARPQPEPVFDHELRATVAELAARPQPEPVFDAELRGAVADLRTAVADLAARPLFDEQLRAAVAQLAARPTRDDELHAAIAALAERPTRDDELHAAVAALAERPTRDDESHAAVARLAARDDELHAAVAALAERPARDDQLHAAVAALAARPTRDDELHAAVARLADLLAQPTPPEDPIRVGITSLHERLSVLLELAAQPPAPDDAVREGITSLRDDLAALRDQHAEHAQAPPPDPQPMLLELGERLRRLEERTAANDEEASTALRLALTRLGEIATAIENIPEPPAIEFPPPPEPPELPDVAALVAPIAEDVAAMNRILTDHPAARLVDSMARVEQQVASLVAQPGPGPAMAMVAAGLAERFEARTDALAESLNAATARLDAVAAAPTDLAERVEQFVGTQFADVARREDAVAAAIAELQAAVARAADDSEIGAVLDRVRTVVEGQQGDVVAMRDALRMLYDAVERHGDVSGQVAGLLLENRAAMSRDLADLGERVQAAVELGSTVGQTIDDAARRMVADVQAMAATGFDPAELDAVAVRISESVRRESELLTQRVASLSVAVDSLRTTLDGLSEEMSNSLGRKATEVGRRLAADLGIKTKKPAATSKDRSLPPGSSS